jgi:hypothetical protein
MESFARILALAAALTFSAACSDTDGDDGATAPPGDTTTETDTISEDADATVAPDVGTPGDTSDVTLDGTLDVTLDVTLDGALDGTPLADGADAATPCDCQPYEHCDEDGLCVDDVCQQGQTTCASTIEQKVCWDDGAGFDLVACPADQACQAGSCIEAICDPLEPPVCEDGQKKVCNSLGTDWSLIPCPGGSACQDGVCITVEPNVILILDTSGSMNATDLDGSLLSECEGDGCAPWAWPDCDDPSAPQTRLGKAKMALQSVVTSETAAGLRMSLQRFPQQIDLFKMFNPELSAPTCGGAPLWGLDKWTADNTQVHLSHTIPAEGMSSASLVTIYPVPFGAQAGGADEVLSWIDGEHAFTSTGEACENLYECKDAEGGDACIDGSCALEENPELRAMGNTPIGRSLFYASEMLRHRVIMEGRTCAQDAECDSPHYTCVSGACHDPLRACRPNVIILLSDGAETLDTWPDKFFHARVQAKRLHYGLGCLGDEDCMNGATCVSGVCEIPGDVELPGGVCHLTSLPCETNAPCFDFKYPCGPSQTCSGECEGVGTEYIDDQGQNLLRDLAGNPIKATVHVVDAAGGETGNALIAKLGGGQHVPVDFEDLESLVDAFVPLLDIKSNLDGCF